MVPLKLLTKCPLFNLNFYSPTGICVIHTRNLARYKEGFHQEPLKVNELKSLPNEKRRRGSLPVKALLSDDSTFTLLPWFADHDIKKFTNMLMMCGKKALAIKVLMKTMEKIKRVQVKKYLETQDESVRSTIECDPVKIMKTALDNAMPVLQLIPHTRGGITYQIPVPISDSMARFRARKWFIRMCRDRKVFGNMHDLLTKEFLDAYNNEGRVIKAKLDLHRICEQNRSYAYYKVM